MAAIGKLTLDTELRTSNFEKELDNLEKNLENSEKEAQKWEEEYERLSKKLDKIKGQTFETKGFDAEDRLTKQLEKAEIAMQGAQNNVEKYKEKITELKAAQEDAVFDKKHTSMKNAENLIKKLKKVGLAMFSIRTAYSLVSKASSAYLSKDVELAEKLQSVWVGLGSLMAPVLEYVSNILLKALGYLDAFIYALTKQSFIAKANAKIIKNQAKAQKDLNKQTATFDEINKASSTTSAGANKGAGTIDVPELNENIVKKLQDMAYWLKDNWYWIKEVGKELGLVFGIVAIGKILNNIGKLIGGEGLGGLASALGSLPTAVTIGITIAGIAYTIHNILKIKKDLEELSTELEDIRTKGEEGYKKRVSELTDINDLIKQQNDTRSAGVQNLKESENWYNKLLGLDKEALKNAAQTVKYSDYTLEQAIKIYDTNKLSKEEQQQLLDSLIEQYNQNLAIIKTLEEAGQDTTELQEITGKYGENIDKVANGLGLSKDKINDMIIKSSEEKDLTKGIYDNIKDINNTKLTDKSAVYTITAEAKTENARKKFANLFSTIGDAIGVLINPVNAIAVAGKNIGKFINNLFSKKLAVGGIVNNPGKGVPIGGAITGEAGQEGVLPLTNPDTMATLGREIGKHVIVNFTNITKLDNRQIAREQREINAQNDFAFNR